MNPAFLVNVPWWKEPIAVQIENNQLYFRLFGHLLHRVISLDEITIAELD